MVASNDIGRKRQKKQNRKSLSSLSAKARARVDQKYSHTRSRMVKHYTTMSINLDEIVKESGFEGISSARDRVMKKLSPKTSSISFVTGLNPYRKLMSDMNTLAYLFPEFPESMMKILIIREKGNTKNVAEFLVNRGWGEDNSIIQNLSSTISPHIEIEYFWGLDNPKYLRCLKGKETGTFFTTFSHKCQYIMHFVNHCGDVESIVVSSPSVFTQPSGAFHVSLSSAIKRPHKIPLNKLIILD
mmetsp:Transcript_38983/g.66867  ORF Transcript_38983/g.66867 Transcript_38983/m.66867 type:complete len:243 (+) Transcript_38983:183-911(+)